MTMLVPAYVAGIIDGEGSIYSRRRNPHLSVGNTSRALIDELAKLGGYVHNRKPGRSLGTKPGWDWVVCGETAAIILSTCLPYLLIKRDLAISVLETWATIDGSNHKAFVLKARQAWSERALIGWPV